MAIAGGKTGGGQSGIEASGLIPRLTGRGFDIRNYTSYLVFLAVFVAFSVMLVD